MQTLRDPDVLDSFMHSTNPAIVRSNDSFACTTDILIGPQCGAGNLGLCVVSPSTLIALVNASDWMAKLASTTICSIKSWVHGSLASSNRN